ncbi:MAG: TolC family protein, partial [Candidatus Tectomicrobia bacterium]|nr:TolC family protein [Candidatus Tectomicrobia bacterium]
WGQQTAWEIDRRLSDISAQPMPTDEELRLSGRLPHAEGLEHLALRRSIDLASARQRMIVAGEQVGFNRATALVPESHIGVLAERDEGAWEVGPTLEFPIPLFDQGQGRLGRAIAELRRTQHQYYAMGVKIRSSVRAARDRLRGAWDRAVYYRDILLPLRERIVNETQLQYNAMQLGVFDLLQSQERQIQVAVAYIEALLDYWLARTDIEQILSGRLPRANNVEMSRRAQPTNGAESGGH